MVGMPPWCRSKCSPDAREVAEHLVERRHAPGGVLVRGREAPAHLRLELRARAVAAVGRDRAALLLGRIRRHVEMDGAGRRLLPSRLGQRRTTRPLRPASPQQTETSADRLDRPRGNIPSLHSHSCFLFLFLRLALRDVPRLGGDHVVDCSPSSFVVVNGFWVLHGTLPGGAKHFGSLAAAFP